MTDPRLPIPPASKQKASPAMMHRTLAGLPEMDHFESDEQRKLALAQIESEAGNPLSRHWWLAVGILVGSAATVIFSLRWLMPRIPIVSQFHREVQDLIRIGLGIVVFAIMLRWLHRRGGQPALREKLLAAGVPICRQCGYPLRGLTLEAARCPECGREFDADVRDILKRNAADRVRS
jgi:hypothetical protein